MRLLALTFLTASLAAGALFLTTGEGQATAAAGGQELYKHEPVMIFDVTGWTLTGPLHTHFTVYNDGFMTYSAVSGIPSVGTEAWTANTAPVNVKRLVKQLNRAGAPSLSDQPLFVSDLPLTTVTLIGEPGNSFSHSYNYWLGINEYAAAHNLIGTFIDGNRPAL